MSEETNMPDQAVGEILKGVTKKTLLLLTGALACTIAFNAVSGTGGNGWLLPLGMAFGAALGLLNFRWLTIAVERVYLKKGSTPAVSNFAAMIINLLKLTAIFIILFIIIKWQLLNVFGLVGGLSLCFLAILWQGLTLMKQTSGGHQ